MPQGIPAMTTFVGAMMLGAVPAFLAYPNFKVEPAKYRFGLAGVTANLAAKAVVIDEEFPDDLLGHVSLGDGAKLIRANGRRGFRWRERADCRDGDSADSLAFIQHSAGTTGLQKGVALTHAAVLTQLEHLVAGAEDRRNDGPHLQLAASLSRHGTDRLLHAAHGLPRAGRDAVAAGLGDASGNHAADHRGIQVHAGMDAEFRVPVRSAANPAAIAGRNTIYRRSVP